MRIAAWVLLSLLPLLPGCRQYGGSPLVHAARTGGAAAIQQLAHAGADLNQREGVNSWTPLQHAIHKHQPAAVRALLLAGADVNAADPRGLTPLMMAAAYGYETIVHDLLKAGANPRARDSSGLTAADLALTGTPDIDRFTVTACQSGTLRALLEAAPDTYPRPRGIDNLIARLKVISCPDTAAVLRTYR